MLLQRKTALALFLFVIFIIPVSTVFASELPTPEIPVQNGLVTDSVESNGEPSSQLDSLTEGKEEDLPLIEQPVSEPAEQPTSPIESTEGEVVPEEEVLAGWVVQGDDTYYYFENGEMAVGWQTIEGNRYYFNANGIMQRSWQTIEGNRYYFNPSGVMMTGWKKISDSWYCFKENGPMMTGWFSYSGSWYYLQNDGTMSESWEKINNRWYYFYPGYGEMVEGWVSISGKWYYFYPGYGEMAEGWQKINDQWYYLHPGYGEMAEGWQWINEEWYYLKPQSGVMAANQWLFYNNEWYYLLSNGASARGVHLIGGRYYFFDIKTTAHRENVDWQFADGYLYSRRGKEYVGNGVIIVNIKNQTMWGLMEGESILRTEVVTGKDGEETPTGMFTIFSKSKNSVLSGPGYSRAVEYWMPFTNEGHGIHDAGWRSEFGGTIYRSNGSLGCINTPASIMPDFFYRFPVGTYLYIY